METIKNYGIIEDCFAKTAHVTSTLLWGNPEKTPQPWLTVLIPTYRRPMLLKQAIESVLTQQHTDCCWELLIVDNEPYDGRPNATEALIRRIDDPRILYYRNSENLRPGDNFNRGFQLARGKWVTMLHDDDLLIANTLKNMGNLIRAYEKLDGKPLGAILAQYVQFKYDEKKEAVSNLDIPGVNSYFSTQPTNYYLFKLTHANVLATAHIGGSIPSNGATYLRAAMLEVGGFNDDFGISADLVLYYCLEQNYSVYSTLAPFGLYRWGANTMIKPEATRQTIQMGFDFREYAYSRTFLSRVVGRLLRACHYRKFTSDVVNEKNNVAEKKITLNDYDSIYAKRPNRLWYFIYIHIILKSYHFLKGQQTKRLCKRVMKGVQE